MLAAFDLPAPDRVAGEPRGAVNTNYHVWAGGRRWFLRLNEGKGDAEVEHEAAVLRHLEAARFPVAPLLRTSDGASHVRLRGRQAMLFAFVEGEEISREAATEDHVRRVGELLGRLREVGPAPGASRPNPYGPARVAGWLDEIAARGDEAVRAALPVLRDELHRAASLPPAPAGLVHGDLFVENVLWSGGEVAAALDWEMSCVDAHAWDLAVCVNAWCYTDRFEPARVRALLAGHRARAPIDPATLAALHPYARLVALRFTASRILGFHLARVGEDRLSWKDWTRYRDRLRALREMGEEAFRRMALG